MRAFNQDWYDNQDLPDEDFNTYVLECYVREFLNKTHTRLRIMIPILEVYLDWNHASVRMWGQYNAPEPHHTLFDHQLLSQCPKVWKSLAASRKAYHTLLREHPLKPPAMSAARFNPVKPTALAAARFNPVKPKAKATKPTAVTKTRKSARLLEGGKG